MNKQYKHLENYLREKLKMPYIKNESLNTIEGLSNWKGNLINSKREFINEAYPFKIKFKDILSWKLKKNKWASVKKNYKEKLSICNNALDFTTNNNDVLIWLGHSTFLFRINGVTFLTDPIFESPHLFLKRNHDLPFNKESLPKIDYLLISHDHRDHLDKKSIRFILNRGDNPTILTGLNIDKWFESNFKSANYSIQAAGWYQQYQTKENDTNVYYLPARHWSKRGLFDTNKRLWGSFLIEAGNKTIYFSGDTGYGSHLKEVGELFKNIDIAILGIGTYQPEWFMEANHISPLNALRAIHEMNAQKFIPMHYGMFDLSDEPILEPVESLIKFHATEFSHINLSVLKVGENHLINS